MLTLTLDRSHQRMEGTEVRHVRARLRPDERLRRRPLDVLLLLDASSSMRGMPFERAKTACVVLARRLRHEDRVDVALFHGGVQVVAEDLGGAGAANTLAGLLAAVSTGYGTRLDLGLDWLLKHGVPRHGRMRMAVLVTDGFPHDAQRRPVKDFSGLRAQADALGRAGLELTAIGLGEPRDFHPSLLHDLARRANGSFLRATEAKELAVMLQEPLQRGQCIAAEQAQILVQPLLPQLRLEAAWRVMPTFAPLVPTQTDGNWSLQVGAVETETLTDILLRLRVRGPGSIMRQGERPLASIVLDISDVRLGPQEIALNFTRDNQKVLDADQSVSRTVRIAQLYERLQQLARGVADDPYRTRELGPTSEELHAIGEMAARINDTEILRAIRQLEHDAMVTGRFSAEGLSGFLSSVSRRRADKAQDR